MSIPRTASWFALFGVPTFSVLLVEPEALMLGPILVPLSLMLLIDHSPLSGLLLTGILIGSVYLLFKRHPGWFALGSTTLFVLSNLCLGGAKAILM